MIVHGYKSFNSDMTNQYGMEFIVDNTYSVIPPIRAKNGGNGFHFDKRLEDTLRYVNGMNQDFLIDLVTGSGEIIEFEDDYYGYYDLYVAEHLTVNKVLRKEEIIAKTLFSKDVYASRFVMRYKLTQSEIKMFKEKFFTSRDFINCLAYYQ